jgi:hypothetical protein
MDEDQHQETGLSGWLTDKPAAEPTPSAEPVTIQGLSDDVTVKVTEVNQPAVAAEALQQFSKETMEQAENENMARNFALSMQAARNPEVVPYTPPAVPKAIAESTRLEMEAGRKRVAEFEEMERLRPKPAPVQDPHAGSSTAIFRPADYVPDQRKGQGNAASDSARPL